MRILIDILAAILGLAIGLGIVFFDRSPQPAEQKFSPPVACECPRANCEGLARTALQGAIQNVITVETLAANCEKWKGQTIGLVPKTDATFFHAYAHCTTNQDCMWGTFCNFSKGEPGECTPITLACLKDADCPPKKVCGKAGVCEEPTGNPFGYAQ